MRQIRHGSFLLGVTLLALFVFLPCEFLRAQGTVKGGFHGTVTDPTGGVIPGATVTIKNLATGVTRSVPTDSAGTYEITQVPPAHYSITITKNGFQTILQPDVELLVNEDREASFALQVGTVSQEVQVTANAAALQTTTSTLGTVVASHEVVDLPLNGRNFTQLILLTPGAVPVGGDQQASNAIVTFGAGGISPTVNAQTGRQNNFTMDGGNNNELYRNIWAISPPPDAIQEFKIQTNTVDSQIYATGANVNVVTKSGGNQIHGDAWEFIRNSAMDASSYSTNISGLKKPAFRMNQYGFTIGGPVVLGDKYDGRVKKTYFFGYWEGFKSNLGSTQLASVPTAAELGGNFSDLLTATGVGTDNLGRALLKGQIFDPYSTRQVTAGQVDSVTSLTATGTGLVRDPFPGNVIPSSYISGSAIEPGGTATIPMLYLKAFYPAANSGPGGNSFPNLAVNSPTIINSNQFAAKMDHSFANNDTLVGAFYYTEPNQQNPNALLLGTNTIENYARVLNLGYTHIFSPTMVATFHYNYIRTVETSGEQEAAGMGVLTATHQLQFEPVKDGIPQVPQLSLSPRLSGTTQFAIPEGPNRSQIFSVDLQKVAGTHTFSGGGLWYHIHGFADGWGNSDSFDQYPTSAIAPNASNYSTTGDGLASALLDLPTSFSGFLGQTAFNGTTMWQGYYVNDKWQASKNLTVTIGMRYDFVPPNHWANDRVSGFSNQCGCYLMPQPFGVLFPFANTRKTYFDPQYRGFQPRLGLAYKFTSKVVGRAGIAMFDDHGAGLIQEVQDLRIPWPFGVDPNLNQLNYGIVNNPNANPATAGSNPQTGGYHFSNPPYATSFFPSPTNANAVPIPFSGADNMNKTPDAIEWNGGIEVQLTPSSVFEVQYVGNRDNHLQLDWTDNSPTPANMGPGPVKGRGPYPTFGEFGYDDNVGIASYNALQVKFDRHFASGFSWLVSYTWSHCVGDDAGAYAETVPQPYNLHAYYGRCRYDIPNVLTSNFVYQLPFGRGQHLAGGSSKAADAVIGGWKLSGILQVRSGLPFKVVTGSDIANTGTGSQRPNLVGNPVPSGFKQTPTQWFSPAAFQLPTAFTFGNLGNNTLRGPGFFDLDFGLMKDFKFSEMRYFEFRAEAFNAFNHSNYGQPSATMNSGTYTRITGLATGAAPRDMQMSLKFVF